MILESREARGGTWDLFRYPGIRSDSDMYTFGYVFKPWNDKSSIADGHKILRYIREAAAEYDVEQHIRYQHKVLSANWSSTDQRWLVTAELGDTGKQVTIDCQFIFSCNGLDPLPYRIHCYFLPIFFGRMRNISTEELLKLTLMRSTNRLKTELLKSIFSTTRSYANCVINFKSILTWQRSMGFEVYDNFPLLTVIVGERDTTLDGPSMLASAEQGQMRNQSLSIIKTVITSHLNVLECAVVGIVDDRTGEAVKAFVVRRNSDLTEAALREFCRTDLTAYKVPKHIEFRDELPKSNVGKILRRELR